MDLALYSHDGWFAVAEKEFPAAEGERVGAFVDRWAARFGGVVEIEIDRNAPVAALTDDERKGLAAGAIALVALTPQFLLR